MNASKNIQRMEWVLFALEECPCKVEAPSTFVFKKIYFLIKVRGYFFVKNKVLTWHV